MGDSFSIDLTKFVQKVRGNSVKVVKKVCFDMFGRAVTRTPVDTGFARSGWQVGINVMPTSSPTPGTIKDARRTGKVGGLTPKGGWGKATGVVGRIAGDILAPIEGYNLGDTIYLVNNVSYITFLEYGTGRGGFSKQAPMGMLRITITEYQAYVAAAVASL
jgi:hypothetical protein